MERAFLEISEACKDMPIFKDQDLFKMLKEEVENHDLSKLGAQEFVQYRNHFFPVYYDDKDSSDFTSAWEHHKAHNRHHHESITNKLDLIHMVIDWTAAGYKFGNTAQEYYEKNKNNIHLKEKEIAFIYTIFGRIKKYNKEKNL